MTRMIWRQIPAHEAPPQLLWTTPRDCQGQIVIVQYGHFGKEEAGPLDDWKRVGDTSNGPLQPKDYTYYRKV